MFKVFFNLHIPLYIRYTEEWLILVMESVVSVEKCASTDAVDIGFYWFFSKPKVTRILLLESFFSWLIVSSIE